MQYSVHVLTMPRRGAEERIIAWLGRDELYLNCLSRLGDRGCGDHLRIVAKQGGIVVAGAIRGRFEGSDGSGYQQHPIMVLGHITAAVVEEEPHPGSGRNGQLRRLEGEEIAVAFDVQFNLALWRRRCTACRHKDCGQKCDSGHSPPHRRVYRIGQLGSRRKSR